MTHRILHCSIRTVVGSGATRVSLLRSWCEERVSLHMTKIKHLYTFGLKCKRKGRFSCHQQKSNPMGLPQLPSMANRGEPIDAYNYRLAARTRSESHAADLRKHRTASTRNHR